MTTATKVAIVPTLLSDEIMTVRLVDTDELVGELVKRALQLNGRGDILTVEYSTDMLGKGKLRAAAQGAFPNGLTSHVRATFQVNYDYGAKVERRTGENFSPVGNWQQAVIANGKLTPLAVHKEDLAGNTSEDDTRCIPGARFYLRGEPLTDAQYAAGFGKKDFAKFLDNNGNEVADNEVKPFRFDKKEQVVKHRTVGVNNLLAVKIGDTLYRLRQR